MRHIGGDTIDTALPYPALVDALAAAFRDGVTTPPRQHHVIPVSDGEDGAMLVMPSWRAGRYTVVKMVSVFPDNAAKGLDSVLGLVVLFDARTGAPLATLDGKALTRRRTAAASALAARYLAREDATQLLIVGAGTLGSELARAHAAVRPIDTIMVWNRTPARAAALVEALNDEGFAAAAVSAPDEAMAAADIVSCATMSPQPLVQGALLKPGAHVDVVGAFRPDMRESDDDTVRRARLYVDTRDGAMAEAGDILIPLEAGVIRTDAVQGDLFDLCRGTVAGRRDNDEITFFKSCGTAVEDWAAAVLAFEATGGRDAYSPFVC